MLANLVHSTWLPAFVLTITIETAVLVLLLRQRPWFTATAVVLLNSVTQPLATIAVTIWPSWFYLIEAMVLVTEGMGLWLLLELSWRKGLLLSLLANGITTTLAVLWLWVGQPLVDVRYFSPMMHDTGKQLLQNYGNPVEAVDHCSHALLNACVHGVVVEYVNEHFSERSPEAWLLWCAESLPDQVEDCEHGVGHSLLINLSGTLNQTLAHCDQAACASGVFMEVSLMGPDLPCDRVDAVWKATCYASAGSYRQYLPGKETIQETEQWCQDHAGAYVADCLYGLQQRLELTVDN